MTLYKMVLAIYRRFISCRSYRALNEKMIMNGLGKMGKKKRSWPVLRVISQHKIGGNKWNHEGILLEQPVTASRFVAETIGI